jgi:hypothetical protein
MVRKILLLILLMTGVALAQNQTPNYHFNLPPHGSLNYDIPINSNFSTLDNLLKQGMVNSYTADPNPCTGLVWYNSTSGLYKLCSNGFPSVISTSGISFSVSGLLPLFSTSTGSSAITFTLLAAQANTVFGNFNSFPNTPSYNSISPCGDSSHALSFVGGTGFGCQALNAGTVTGLSSGNVGGLFNVSIANPNTAPSITFTAQNSPANSIFGNFTGSSLPPTNNLMSPCGDSAHALGWVAGAGFNCVTVSGGTITSLNVSNLSPLFNTNITNPNTTPSVTYTLSNAAANTLFGNFTGSSAGPIYNSISPCGDGTHALGWVAGTGFTCQAVGVLPSASAQGQVLVSAGAGTTYVAQTKPAINPLDFGVDCTGLTDTSAALNTLFTAINQREVDFPQTCQMRVDHQVVIQSQAAFVLKGLGDRPGVGGYGGPSIYGCNGSAGAVLYINRSGFGRIEGLGIYPKGNPGVSGCAASSFTGSVQVDSTGNPGVTTHKIIFDHVALTTSPQGGAITGYFGIKITDGGKQNGENIVLRNSWIHCQNSVGSFGWDNENGTSDKDAVEDSDIHGCFQGARLFGGNTTLKGNLFSANGNFSVFGSGGGSIWIGSCSSGPLNIVYNEETDGAQFINTDNDAGGGVGCTGGVNVIGNDMGVSDYDTANTYPINLGTTTGSYIVEGNQINLTQTPTTTVVGSKSQGTFGPQGTIILKGNTFQNNNGVALGFCCQSPGWQQGQFELGGAGFHFIVPTVSTTYDEVDYGTAKFGFPSPFKMFRATSTAGGINDDWTLENVTTNVPSNSTSFIIAHTAGQTGTAYAAIDGALSGLTLAPITAPGTPTLQQFGSAGTTSYSYVVCAVTSGGQVCSAVATTALGAATLNTTNYNEIQSNGTAGALKYCFYRTASAGTPNTTGLIKCIPAASFPLAKLGYTANTFGTSAGYFVDDKGLAGDGTTPQVGNTTGQLNLANLGKGNPLTTDGTSIKNSQIYVDASQFVGANGADPTDDCATVKQALLAATLGQRVTASALTGDRKCKSNPYPSTGQDIVEWGPSHWWMQGNFSVVVPSRLYTIGRGRDANPPTGLGATTFTACTSITSNCLSTFTSNIMWCWGAGGVCGVGGGTSIVDAPITNITLDCASATNIIGLQDMVSGGRSGAHNVKLENCVNQNSRGLQLAGTNYPSTTTVTVTLGSNLVAGTGFTPDMLNNQIQFSSQAGTNYHVTARTPTQLTLDVNYTGTTSAAATITVSNSSTQSSDFSDLFFSSGSVCDHTGVPLLVNTGSDTNFGPLAIQRVMVTNSCTTTTEPDYTIRFSGTKTRFTDIHVEGFNIAGTVFGLDAPTAEVSLVNVDCGAVNTTTGSTTNLLLISNAFTARDIKTTNLKCVAPNPVNLIQDQINSNTVPWSSEASMAEYTIGLSSNIVQTTSGTVTSKLYGMQVLSNYGFSSTTTCSSGTNIFQAVANTLSTCINGVETIRWGSAGSRLFSTYALQWTNGTAGGGTVDLTVQRSNPQTLNIGTTSADGKGYIEASAVRVLSNATFGTGGNVITTTALTAIPGLSWTIPAAAQAYDLNCKLAYTQATAAAANQFGVQFNTTAPQHGLGFGHTQITVGPPSTYTDGTSSSLAVTTPVSLVTFTPGATATVYQSELHVTFLASGSGTATVNILAATGSIADLLTINADSSCRIEVTNN